MNTKWLSAVAALSASTAAFADEAAAVAPPVNVDPTGLIVFAALMVAMIGGFAAYVYHKEKGNKGGAAK